MDFIIKFFFAYSWLLKSIMFKNFHEPVFIDTYRILLSKYISRKKANKCINVFIQTFVNIFFSL